MANHQSLTPQQAETRHQIMVARIVAETLYADFLPRAIAQVKRDAAAMRAEGGKYASLTDIQVAVAYMTAAVDKAQRDPRDAPQAALYTAVVAIVQGLEPDDAAKVDAAKLLASK